MIRSSALLLAFFLCLSAHAHAHEHLVLVGGGTLPDAGVRQFLKWSGGKRGKILIIPWADGTDWRVKAAQKNFLSKGVASAEIAPPVKDILPPGSQAWKEFKARLEGASGIFFTGGDQSVLMKAIKQAELKKPILDLYHLKGVAIGGTSAGTAIASNPMIYQDENGDGQSVGQVKYEEGMGFLGDVLVDQHFMKRKRLPRLIKALKKESKYRLGIGVEEGEYVAIKEDRYLTSGGDHLTIVEKRATDGVRQPLYPKKGGQYDLMEMRPIGSPEENLNLQYQATHPKQIKPTHVGG